MKRALRQSKRRIEDRLRDRFWLPQDHPMFSAKNIHFELSSRERAIGVGGIGAMQLLAQRLGLAKAIDHKLRSLRAQLPYHCPSTWLRALRGTFNVTRLAIPRRQC